MPSPFAADRMPDGSRRYSHRAVVARRTLLAGIVVAGAGTGVGLAQLRGEEPAAAGEPGHSTTDPASPWVVVNKKRPLVPGDHVPASLTEVAGEPVATAVVPDLTALLAAGEADGVRLTLTSGYRSRAQQEAVHERAVRRDGREVAERFSARPGYSEHQTGLAVDFGSAAQPACAVQDCFGQTPEARWLAAHAGGFGFLLRYPAGLTPVTGYAPESWHYRWVGRELVARMAERGVVTLEEFFGVPGGPGYA
ncbi:hypothetical protein NUM3379_35440 [Kineococcus sp. NUM-3379]